MSQQLNELLKHLTREKLEAELYRKSFFEFVKSAFKLLHHGEELTYNWHIEYLCNRLQREGFRLKNKEKREKHLVINVPPRTLKSEMINVFFSVWLWLINPNSSVLSTSYSHTLSLKHSLSARRIIESDWFIARFPEIELSKDENTKSSFSNNYGGVRFATSTGGTATGMGGDVVIIDDPQNPKLARSETERENANRYFNETLRSRLNNPSVGVFIIIMQRLHERDLTGTVLELEPDKWEHICLPAEKSDNITPIELEDNYVDDLLFPDLLTKDVLSGLKVGLGSYGYSGQYLQKPSPDEGGIIKRDWFDIIEEGEDTLGISWDFYIDTAYTNKQENDPSVILVGAKRDNIYYVKKVIKVRQEFPELLNTIVKAAHSYGNSRTKIFIEPKASGLSVAQQLRKQTSLNIIEAKAPENDKISRVNAVSPIIQSKRVKLIDGSWVNDFIDECAVFPNAAHDDQVDCLTMLLQQSKPKILY